MRIGKILSDLFVKQVFFVNMKRCPNILDYAYNANFIYSFGFESAKDQ